MVFCLNPLSLFVLAINTGQSLQFNPQYPNVFISDSSLKKIKSKTGSENYGSPPKYEEIGSINGGMMKRQRPVTSPVITVGVEDIESAIKNVKKMGGEIIRGKIQMG